MPSLQPAALVMTATITPPEGVPNLKRTDPRVRLRDYLDALRFYLALPTSALDRIVFLENSESDLSELQDVVRRDNSGKRVEFISFQGLDYPPIYARAYGEFRMLDHGFRHSTIIGSLAEDEHFWKITGRLKVHNFADIVAATPPVHDLVIDFQKRPTPMVDLRFFSCSKAGYRRLWEGRYLTLRQDLLELSAEGFLYASWHDQYRKLGIIPRHRKQPKISGVGGQHNEDYLAGINALKYWIRAAGRVVAPGFWI